MTVITLPRANYKPSTANPRVNLDSILRDSAVILDVAAANLRDAKPEIADLVSQAATALRKIANREDR